MKTKGMGEIFQRMDSKGFYRLEIPEKLNMARVAVELAVAGMRDPANLIAQVVIPQFHAEMLENLEAAPEFRNRIAAIRGEPGGVG